MDTRQAFNPYLPSYEYVPDGEPRVFGDRLYVYGSHDQFNGNGFCLNDYVCWSAPLDDLGNWKYEGVIFRAAQDPANSKGSMHMNAPDCIQGPDGRYYLYYQLSALACTSVAVCDTPAGEYQFYGYVEKDGHPYGNKAGEPFCFDPGVLVADDGRIWLYVGFSPRSGILKWLMGLRGCQMDGCYCIELEQNMKTVKSDGVMVVPGPGTSQGTPYEGHGFYEASSPRLIAGKYYLVYSSILSHELCYAVSENADRGFQYGGTLVSIGDIGYHGRTEANNYTGNTHGGMVEIDGQWYIFYHRQTNQQKCARQGCAEKIFFEEDGSIPQIEMTSCGLNPIPLRGTGTYEARIACNMWSRKGTFPYLKTHEKDKRSLHPYFTQSGEDREENPDQYIANMTDGSTAGFKYFDLKTPKSVTVTLRGTGTGQMVLRLKPDCSPAALFSVHPCVGWSDFTGIINRPITGIEALYFTYTGKGYVDFKAFTITE